MSDVDPLDSAYCYEHNIYLCEDCLNDRITQIRREKKTMDKVIEAVQADLQKRSEFGIKKYGVSLERKDLSLRDWLEHAYFECLDQASYLKRTIMELDGEL